ncbi:MAG: hypothetical protein AAFO85_15105 [Cyanobacteria bacterium J06598_4]
MAVVSGGAARFLEPEIEAFFNCQQLERQGYSRKPEYYERSFDVNEYEGIDDKSHVTPVVWGAGLQSRVMTTFDLTDAQQSLSYRLIDAYGLFDYLLGKNSMTNSARESQSKPEPDVSSEENQNG